MTGVIAIFTGLYLNFVVLCFINANLVAILRKLEGDQ